VIAHPVFSPDARWLYFVNGPLGGTVDVWRIPSTGGDPVRITTGGAFRPEPSTDGTLLYYGKFKTSELWSVPVAGGQQRLILNSVAGVNWTVTPNGIYYFDFAVPHGAPKLVKFYSFRAARSNQVGAVEATVSVDFSGISITPDGRWMLYSHEARATSDLMLLEGFR
jgi:Tol biopolymer transport system component